jgi:hypothetical protein
MQRHSFLQDVSISHGPTDLLSRLFERADEAIARRGITLSLGTIDELVDINEAHKDTWLPLFPTFDPRFGGADRTNTLCWIGRNLAGDVIATQAARRFDWSASTFADEAESLRLMYPDPARDRRPGEQCVVTAQNSRRVQGCAAFIGAMWYRRDVRGLGLPNIMSRIARCSAHAAWETDYAVGMISESVMLSDLGRKSGHANVDWSAFLSNSMYGDVKFAIVWTDTNEMQSDARAFLATLEGERLDRSGLRSA